MSGHRASDQPRGNSSNNYGGLTQLFFALGVPGPMFFGNLHMNRIPARCNVQRFWSARVRFAYLSLVTR
jgi:hypothetical protein